MMQKGQVLTGVGLKQELGLDHLHPSRRFQQLVELVDEGRPSRSIKTISEHATVDKIERFRRQGGPLEGLIHVPSLLLELHDASLLFFVLLVAGCASSGEDVNASHLYENVVSLSCVIEALHLVKIASMFALGKAAVTHQNFLAIVSSKQVIDPGTFAESTI
jgi:hypothetical protein